MDVHTLAERGWPELVLIFMDIDRIIGPRARRFTRTPQQEVRQAHHAPAAPTPNPPAWDTARPHQQPASWGQNTVSMPSAQSAGEPMSVNQIGGRAPTSHSGGAGAPYYPSEQCCRIRDNRCSDCCDHVPTGTAHPDPCDKPATCHNCLAPGHIKRDCPQAQGGGHPSQPPPGQQPAQQHPRGRGRGRGHGGRRANPQPPAQAAYPPQQALNAFGQRATYHQSLSQIMQPSLHAIQGHSPTHYGNRLSNVYWGRVPPRVRNRPRRRRTNHEGLTIDQRIDRMGRDLVQIREAMEWAMKEMTRLKDHVDYQLDLRAPFTFMFNHISQDPAAQPPAADLEAPTFVQEEAEYAELAGDPSFIQEEAEYAELTGNDSPWGQLHCIREGEGEPVPPQPDPGEGDPGPLDAQTHVDPVLGAEEHAAGRSDQPPPAAAPPPSARASRPPRRGFSSPFTTSFMASLLGLIALTASVDGLASPPASFNTSEPSGTPQLGEWSALPGVPPMDPSSHLRLEVIVAILIAPLILKLAAWIPRGVGRDREQPNPDSETEGGTSDPPPHGPGNPLTPFLPLDWLKKGAGADSCLLNVYRHRGYEIAAMQQADPPCVAFINHAFPSHARALPTGPSLRVDPGELAAMITRKGKYRIIRTANVKSWSLLTYGSGRQVYAPAECRLMLLAAAHAAAMAGMGAPCHLLKKAFYWPSLDKDARKYAWTSKIQRRRRSGRKQHVPQPRAGGAATADASTRSHGPTKLPASVCGPPAGRPRFRRGSPSLRGVEPRPDTAHEERSQAAHPHCPPAPMAELAPFGARQNPGRIVTLP